jgi:hypothetical protein
MRQQLQQLQQRRLQQSQNTNMSQMGNPQGSMPGMMGQQMQASMSNQGNPMAQQFNPQLGTPQIANPQLAQQMRPSALPMNGQGGQGMQMAGMPNQNHGPQQQAGNRNISLADQQKINELASRMLQKVTEEQKASITRNFQSMPPQRQNQLRSQFGDPIIAHFRNQARNLYFKQMGIQMPNQGAPNGMQNPAMGQQNTPMMQRSQPQMNGQQNPDVDFSRLMSQMTDQQQNALQSANAGQLVVPASNNAMMQQGMPMGLAAGQMGMNSPAQMQNAMQQRPGGITSQQQAAQRLAQSQIQASQIQARLHAQNGQPNQQNQMTPQMKMGNSQSPMPHMSQPGMPPGQQQLVATPQQRPTPTPTPQMPQQHPGQLNPELLRAMQQGTMGNQQAQIRRPLPPDLPPNLPQNVRNFLQVAPDDQYEIALAHLRKQQMAGTMGGGSQGGQMSQLGQGMQREMMSVAQTQQMNQIRMTQQRGQQIPNQNPSRPGGQMGQIVPEVIQQMDQRPFPRTLLQANSAQMVPAHIQTFLQLKDWIMNNPSMAGSLTPQRLSGFQMAIWTKERQQQNQINVNIGIGGQPNNGQGGTPGPAPTAPMVPPGALNNMGQPQPQQRPATNHGMLQQMQAELQNITVTPQEIAVARQGSKVPPTMSDDEIRGKLVNMKRAALAQRYQQAQRNMQMQNQQQVGGNQIPNQRMPQNQMPQNQMPQPPQRPPIPGQQTPQMGMQTPNNQAKQQTPRPGQQTPVMKTPLQQAQPANKLKRPPPDEIIEITDNTPAPQAPQMQATKSQQARNSMPNNQAGQQAAPDAQAQVLQQRFGAILLDVKSKHQPRPPLALTEQERQQLLAKVNEFRQIIIRLDWAIRLFFGGSRDEERTKWFFQRYWHITDNVNPKEGTLLGQPTVRAADFDQLLQPFKKLVVEIMASKKQQQENAQKGQVATGNQLNGQQPPQQANGQVPQPAPQQLNAANLEQHTANLRQQAGHRRTSSKVQVPQAPTAGPGQKQFDFNTSAPSPHGIPKYGEGAGNLTPDKLNLPRKKQKKDGQPPSGTSTPAAIKTTPQIGKVSSPQIKKQPLPEVPQMPLPPKHACRDSSCEFSRKGFNTPEELTAHMQQFHAPPADPLKYALETLATSVGLNADGSSKTEVLDVKPPHPANKTAPHIKADTSPPSGSTPLHKIPMKGSPALDRLKTPQHTSKPPAPTSAAGPPTDKTIRKGEGATKSGDEMALDLVEFDPWKDSGLQQTDLIEWLKPYDTFTGDWGNDRALRSPQLTPATTPDTNITDKTASTRDSEILDGDALNMTLALNPNGDEFMTWREVDGWEPGIMDPDLMNDLAAVGIDESMVLKLDDKTDINDWEAMFGPDSNIDGNKVPGWENTMNDFVF